MFVRWLLVGICLVFDVCLVFVVNCCRCLLISVRVLLFVCWVPVVAGLVFVVCWCRLFAVVVVWLVFVD